MRSIIIDGADGVGKSTLISYAPAGYERAAGTEYPSKGKRDFFRLMMDNITGQFGNGFEECLNLDYFDRNIKMLLSDGSFVFDRALVSSAVGAHEQFEKFNSPPVSERNFKILLGYAINFAVCDINLSLASNDREKNFYYVLMDTHPYVLRQRLEKKEKLSDSDKWVLENPEKVLGLYEAYAEWLTDFSGWPLIRIDNTGSLDELEEKAKKLFADLK